MRLEENLTEVRREDPIVRVVNDPQIVLTPAEKKAINNPKMTPDREAS